MSGIDYASGWAWALDFSRALYERPKIIKWLINILIGRYARRELNGFFEDCKKQGLSAKFSYDLQNIGYHKDRVESWLK